MLQFFAFFPSFSSFFFFAITCGLLRIGHVRVRKGVRVCGRTGMCYASTSVLVSFLPSTLAQACVDNTCVTVNLCELCVQQGNFCLHVSLHGCCDPTKLGSCCQPLGVPYKIAANLPKQFANLLQIRVNTDMTQSTPTAACEIDKDRQQHKTVCVEGEGWGTLSSPVEGYKEGEGKKLTDCLAAAAGWKSLFSAVD